MAFLASLLFPPSSPAAASPAMTAANAAGGAAVEADEEARRLGELLAPLHGSALQGMLEAEEAEGGGLLSDPLPLYVYRTR